MLEYSEIQSQQTDRKFKFPQVIEIPENIESACIAATAVVITQSRDSILLIDKLSAGKVGKSFPGGGKEPYETSQECVIRELFEETRIRQEMIRSIKPVGYIKRTQKKDYVGPDQYIIQYCVITEGKPELLENSNPIKLIQGQNEDGNPRWYKLSEVHELAPTLFDRGSSIQLLNKFNAKIH